MTKRLKDSLQSEIYTFKSAVKGHTPWCCEQASVCEATMFSLQSSDASAWVYIRGEKVQSSILDLATYCYRIEMKILIQGIYKLVVQILICTEM